MHACLASEKVTPPFRACHKLLGNFFCNFSYIEQDFAFLEISSFLDIGQAFSALIDRFYTVSVDNLHKNA